MSVSRPWLWRWLLVVAVGVSCLSTGAVAQVPKGKAAVQQAKALPATVIPVPRKDPWWTKRHEQINDRIKQGGVDLVFIGDSITQGWEGAGKDVWKEFYEKRNAANLGIGGDQTQHVLYRLGHGNIQGISPKLAVLMIGTNNTHGFPPEEIAAGIRAIVRKLRSTASEELPPPSLPLEAAAGAGSGFMSMVANAGSLIYLYLLRVRLPMLTFLGTGAWYFFVVNLVKLPISVGLGLITSTTLVLTLVLSPVVAVGAVVGRVVVKRLTLAAFEWIVLVVTLLAALNLVR